jgi:uncharacterized protein (DUF1697 family)
MPRYAAFLRGVSPMNARMPALKACFEAAGFTEVRTLLSSGNVVFNARSSSLAALERRTEKAMRAELDRSSDTFVRPTDFLQQLLAAEPFAEFRLPRASKRIVVFLREPAPQPLALPIERDDASILKCVGSEALCAYVPGPKGPAFMGLLERTFGTGITTRTLDTVRKCAYA